jgi:hypothetical protein
VMKHQKMIYNLQQTKTARWCVWILYL